jgi:hypothetical protein
VSEDRDETEIERNRDTVLKGGCLAFEGLGCLAMGLGAIAVVIGPAAINYL